MPEAEEHVTARLETHGTRFEILVRSELAWRVRSGKPVDMHDALVGDFVYKDAKKGLKDSEDIVQKVFGTQDIYKIAEEILKRGEIQLTSEQRRNLAETKKRQIVNFITRNAIDPKTGLPHPATRIELAMEEARVSIDPFRDAEVQAMEIIKELRPLLPLKVTQLLVQIKIPPVHASRTFGRCRSWVR
jgi:ribosome maturation protein SDO1